MRPTMADVAKRVGVSTSTVSLVLNGRDGVSAQMREAVIRAADELGYRLPKRQRRENSAAVKTIAVVHFATPGLEPESSLSGLAANYVSGIQRFCQSNGLNWALVAHYQEGNPQHVGYELLEGGKLAFDGLIVIMPFSRASTILQHALNAGIPTVVISRDWPDLPVCTVGQDHPQQARLAVDHLVQLGHRRIAFVADAREEAYDWFKVRWDTYCQATNDLQTYDPELIVSAPQVRSAVKALIARRPDVTALFCTRDVHAVRAMRGLRDAGIWVPEQVSVIGVGNDTPAPKGCPGLTTVGFPAKKVGYLSAQVLLEHIQDPERAYSRIFVQSWLVERESCIAPKIDKAPSRVRLGAHSSESLG